MGVNLWGASPLYENHSSTSTSPRQGRKGDRPSEGSLRQTCEPTNRNRIQGSVPEASQHYMTKPTGSGDRVNAAVVHGQFTFLSGEICLPCDRIVMRESGKGLPGKQGPGLSICCCQIRVLRGKHKPDSNLMMTPIAPFVETRTVSMQKSADGIVVSFRDEGRNAERRNGIP
jgi:hypothetical protein